MCGTKILDAVDKGQFVEMQISQEGLQLGKYSLEKEIMAPERCIHLPQNIMLPGELGHLLFLWVFTYLK